MSDRFKQGDATRTRTLGAAHVARSKTTRDGFNGPFLDLLTESAWGHVWSSDAIPPRQRSMVTLALLAGLGNWEEFELHLRATANTGCTRDDIREVLMHVAIYAGVPRANHGFKIAREILDQMEKSHD
ncbi:carboxymuconolactone decarboxylase family protein [mine drainage metagenome]|uniref:Carboxymuconolactone decarboxylase family protein n=1 Tax=mine drainage metagenome TaxID=410659 RepID=A0A1J5PNN2_9ZZZZ